MADMYQVEDNLNLQDQANKELPTMLNVLTILTFICSALVFVFGIIGYFTVCDNAEKMASQDMPEMGGMLGNMMEDAIELSIKQCDNRLVVLVATLVTSALCFFGAFMMRGRKKQGFMVYLIGELLGPVSMMLILGSMAMGGMAIAGVVISVLMVILYASQRKHLIY